MSIRPAIRAGDVVKLSKKGRSFSRTFPKNSPLVVSDVYGDGIDRESILTCRVEINGRYESYKFYRSQLWRTGKNVFDKAVRVLNFNKS